MFNLCNISAAQAAGYYEKDNYYLRTGGGQWLGSLKDHFKLPDQINPRDFNRLIEMHEKFRTFEMKFFVSKELNRLKDDPAFRQVHDRVMAQVMGAANAELKQKHGFKVTFKPEAAYQLNREGNLVVSLTSHNVAVKRCKQAAEVLFDSRYRELYRIAVAEALKGIGIEAKAGQFNLQAFENSGRVGFDLTFSPPKSVSIALTVNDEFKEALKEAHDRAVQDTLEYIRENLVEYRVGREAQRFKTGDVLIAKIDHLVSRDLDPQLHSHCILFNTCRGKDGKLRSIANERLYDKQKFVGIHVYKTQLAHYVRQAGFEIEVGDHHSWELKGISRQQIEAFSNRWLDIRAYMEKKEFDPADPKDRERANLATRLSKREVDFDELRQVWARTRREFGIDEKTFVRADTFRPGRDCTFRVDESLSQKAHAFSRDDYISMTSAEAVKAGVPVQEIDRHFDRQVREREFIPVSAAAREGEFFITRENHELEKQIFERVRQARGRSNLGLKSARYRHYLDSTSLTVEQRAAVEHIISAKDRFTAVNGVAGSGKTGLLKEVKHILEQGGYTLQGLSFTGKAAHKLEQEAGIASRTLHSLFSRLERQAGHETPVPEGEFQNCWNFDGLRKSAGKEVWLVGEANMINNSLMDHLQRAATLRGASVVMLGDFRRLPPIGGGNAYSRLVLERRIDCFDLKSSLRQNRALASVRDAVREAALGNIRSSLRRLDSHIVEVPGRDQRFHQIALRYSELDPPDRLHSVIITGTNKDRIAINEQVREMLKGREVLKEGVTFKLKDQKENEVEREMAVNDRIVFLRNDRELGVANGQVGVVRQVDRERGCLTVETLEHPAKTIEVAAETYRYLDHFYAATTWKTVGDSYRLVLAHIDTRQSALNSAEDYYGKISRAIDNVIIFTDDRYFLLDEISRSHLEGKIETQSNMANRFNLLPAGVQKDLQKASKFELLAAHMSGLSPSGNDTRPKKYRSKAGRCYERAVKKYSCHITARYHSELHRAQFIREFRRCFVPASIDTAGIKPIQPARALEYEHLHAFFEKVDRRLFNGSGIDVFSREDYIALTSTDAARAGVSLQQIEDHFEAMVNDREFLPLPADDPGGSDCYTTKENADLKSAIFERVRQGLGQGNIMVDAQKYLDYLQHTDLTAEQQEAVTHIITTKDRFSALNGVAGSGKTSLLKDVKHIMESEGYALRGLAFTGKAAFRLNLSTGIKSSTLHSFFNQLERRAGHKTFVPEGEFQNRWNFDGLKPSKNREVWLVDEANMINNSLMDHLQRAALSRGANVIMLGDYRQLPPIGGGRAYSCLILEERIRCFDLTTGFRQRHAFEPVRRAVEAAAAGNIRQSLQWLRPNTFEVFYADERFHCMANMYTNLSPTEQQNSIIITGTNRDRIALNRLVRHKLKLKGVLQPGEAFKLKDQKERVIEREMAVNDRIIFLRNHRELGVFNGQTGIVRQVAPDRLTVETLPEKNTPARTIEVDTAKYSYLDHFYATTTWKVEGESYLYSLINIDTWQNRINCREDFYVKISRAQKNLFIFTDDRSYLFAAVSGSSYERSLPPHQVQRNRFGLLSRQVQTHLLKASQHYLHFDALREGRNHCPHFQVHPDTPSAQQYHHYLTDQFTRSLSHYRQAVTDFSALLDPRTPDPELKAALLSDFKQTFIPPDIAPHLDTHLTPPFTPNTPDPTTTIQNLTLNPDDLTPPDLTTPTPDLSPP